MASRPSRERTIRTRIVLGIGGNAYGQIVTIAIQLASFPIFLSVWSAEQYGLWLVAVSLQAYLVLADFGIVSAITSRLAVLLSRGAPTGAQRLLSSGQASVVVVGIIFLALGVALAVSLPRLGVSIEYALVVAILAIDVAAFQFTALGCGILRATHRNHLAGVASANARVAEWAVGVSLLLITQSPMWTATGMLVGQSAAACVVLFVALRGTSLRWAPTWRSLKLARLYLHQSFANFAIAVSGALTIQGFSLLVAAGFGPSQVVAFNAYRTISRTVVQATGILSHAAWPEYSRLYGSNQHDDLRRLYWRTQQVSILSTVSLVALMLFLTPWFLPLWTRGEVAYVLMISVLFGVYAIAASLWHVPRVLLTAVGRNGSLSIATMVASAIGFGFAAGAALLLHSIPLTLAAMITIEVACGATAIIAVHRLLARAGGVRANNGNAN